MRHSSTSTAHASVTPSAGSSAENSLAAAVAPLVQADDYHVAVAVADLTTGQAAACDGTQPGGGQQGRRRGCPRAISLQPPAGEAQAALASGPSTAAAACTWSVSNRTAEYR